MPKTFHHDDGHAARSLQDPRAKQAAVERKAQSDRALEEYKADQLARVRARTRAARAQSELNALQIQQDWLQRQERERVSLRSERLRENRRRSGGRWTVRPLGVFLDVDDG